MKKIFSFVAAALMSASMFAEPATVPTVTDLAGAGYDVNNRVICLYFDEQVCNDVVWAGSYNEWNTGNPAEMLKFEAFEGFEGWYVVEVADTSATVQGKPVQLKKDGSFSWDFQSGDVEAWINKAQPGTQTATIEKGYDGEANCTWPTTGAYIYELAYFKLHNSPCGADKAKHTYTIKMLDPLCDDSFSPAIIGAFNSWSEGVPMEWNETEGYYIYVLENVEEGTEFKFKEATDTDWSNQIQELTDEGWKDLGNNACPAASQDTTLVYDYSDTEKYRYTKCAPAAEYKYTEYENWQIKYGNTWEWSDNMEKVEDGLFKLEVLWEGTGFNVKSDENPIKKDWFAPEDLTVADGVNAPATVDVYLKVIDDETIALGVGAIPTGLAEIKAAKVDGKFIMDGQLYIKTVNGVYNVLGATVK